VFFTVLMQAPIPQAHAQATCNPNAPWVTQFGTMTIGDVLIYGPGCNQFEDGGIQAATSTTIISGATTVSNANCGTIFLPTVAANAPTYGVTMPAAASLPNNCIIGVIAPSGRGVNIIMPGTIYASPGRILWPTQSIRMIANNSAGWQISDNPNRWLLTASQEICVVQGGNDQQDGLVTSAASGGCMGHVQSAVFAIGQFWDGGGYNACSIGVYAGGTSIINESVSTTGQSVGCFLTFNIRGVVTWTGPTSCISTGDNGIAIFNANLGFAPILKCNSTNPVGSGQFYLHQNGVFDINGAMEWVPQGSNDTLVFIDAQGRVNTNFTNGGLVIGDANAETFEAVFRCDEHCAGFTGSGTAAFSPNVSGSYAYVFLGGSWGDSNITWTGTFTGALASIVSGNSVFITNGVTIPGGAPAATTGGQVCATKC
jgi:hypothetical protein